MILTGQHKIRVFLLAPVLLFAAARFDPIDASQERFPHPDFSSGYTLPSTTAPPPSSMAREWVDVLALLSCLSLASFLALKARYRWAIVTLSIFSLVYFGFWRKGCVCPVGATQNIVAAATSRSYQPELSVVAFFVLPLVFTLFWGRTFCAAVCPLGAIQDLVLLRPIRLPRWLNHVLSMLPYVTLCFAVLFTVTGAGFVICRYDPFVGFFRLGGFTMPMILGGVLLLLGTFVGRPYCRFLCPYSVLLGWASRLAKWHVSITPDECVQCRLCESACPFDAIRPPGKGTGGEPRLVGIRRLVLLLLLLPVLTVSGGWLFSGLAVSLSRVHRIPRLAERIWLEETKQIEKLSLESEAFRVSGKAPQTLYAEATTVVHRFERLGWILGMLLGLSCSLKLVSLSVYRARRDYEPDQYACVSCARCFSFCPKEIQRRRKDGPRKQS
ncbi:MAG: 4Fe-4S binding protein [Kiritimatiellia bacterium]